MLVEEIMYLIPTKWIDYIKYCKYLQLSQFLGDGKGSSHKHLNLYMRHISYRNHCSQCKPCTPVVMKQLINNACQLMLQSGVFGVTCLFINYNIKANRNSL